MVRYSAFTRSLKGVILQTIKFCATMSTDMFAVVQLASTNEKVKNLDKVVHLVTEAAEKGAKVCFLYVKKCSLDDFFARVGGFYWNLKRGGVSIG